MSISMSTSETTSETNLLETPAERRRRRVRDEIIDAAERVFREEGPEGLSIRRLADEIDYSPSAIYKYFASKTELMTCLKEAFFERLIKRIEEVTSNPDRPKERIIRDCVETYIHTAIERPHHYIAAFSSLDEEGDPAPAFKEACPESSRMKAYEALLDQVNQGVEAGLFRRDLPRDLTAKSLWSSMHGLALLMIHIPGFGEMDIGGRPVSRDQFIQFHADLLARGLSA
ncbi:TetR/AcrR family transcriptional regulator [Ponticaulis profundi]|uniref:TetR/AcrR family transcriptional regulator n=1 Tax=Ponticaulis profundi TaxID=2665222 RepID=A0ABW1S6W7_9PROT